MENMRNVKCALGRRGYAISDCLVDVAALARGPNGTNLCEVFDGLRLASSCRSSGGPSEVKM